MRYLTELIALSKELRVLYVEDDEELRKETEAVLMKIFANLESANNGKSALKLFRRSPYDLVITDIRMPQLDGLGLSREIKKIAPEVPVVIVSAYSHTNYLMEAIAVGINHYILKPIKVPNLVETLYGVVKGIVDQRLADTYRKEEMQRSIMASNEKVLEQITNASPNPTVIYSESKVMFFNDAFRDLFDPEELQSLVESSMSLEALLNTKISVDPVLIKEGGFIEELDAFESCGECNKLSLKTRRGRKIFLVLIGPITLGEEACMMYTFNDITVIEYQKAQLDNYNDYMSNLASTKYKAKERTDVPSIVNNTKIMK